MPLTARFEEGTNGATIVAGIDTPVDSGWDVVNIGTDATLTYDNTVKYNNLSGKYTTGATSSTCYTQWSTSLGTVTDHYGRMYINTTHSTSATILNFNTAGTANVRLRMKTTTRQIEVLDNLGAVIGTTTNALNLNGWTRIEWRIVHSLTVGSVEVKLFLNADSYTADETLTLTNQNTAASSSSVRIGYSVAASNLPAIYIDNIVVNATSYPGPDGARTAWLIA